MFEEYLFASIVIATCTSYLFLCKKSGPHRQLQKGNTTKSNDKSKDDIKGTPSPTKKSPKKEPTESSKAGNNSSKNKLRDGVHKEEPSKEAIFHQEVNTARLKSKTKEKKKKDKKNKSKNRSKPKGKKAASDLPEAEPKSKNLIVPPMASKEELHRGEKKEKSNTTKSSKSNIKTGRNADSKMHNLKSNSTVLTDSKNTHKSDVSRLNIFKADSYKERRESQVEQMKKSNKDRKRRKPDTKRKKERLVRRGKNMDKSKSRKRQSKKKIKSKKKVKRVSQEGLELTKMKLENDIELKPDFDVEELDALTDYPVIKEATEETSQKESRSGITG